MKCEDTKKCLEEKYPLCHRENRAMFDDMLHHVVIMEDAASKLNVPVEELMDFFCSGREKINSIKECEESLRKNE